MWIVLFALLQAGGEPNLEIIDYPGDRGDKIIIRWDKLERGIKYKLVVNSEDGEVYKELEFTSNSDKEYLDTNINLPFWVYDKSPDSYSVIVSLKEEDGNITETKITANLSITGPDGTITRVVTGSPQINFFKPQKLNNVVIAILFCVLIIYFIKVGKKKELRIRRLPGLDAMDEAIGRATEMGKPVVYQLGLLEIGEDPLKSISVLASFGILSEVAYKVAQYETSLYVPHRSALNMVICQEITKEAYTRAGKPHLYNEDYNMFISNDQFAYVIGVEGIYMREKPATCIYMGYFYAESLILAETANDVGAIQIAGTDAWHQLPFFFAACDYTLIGEELYAAGAYLSKEPTLLAGIKVQDYLRLTTIALMIISLALTIAGNNVFIDILKLFK